MAVVFALDYGRKRVGVAVSDPTQTFVFPRPTLHRKVLDADLLSLKCQFVEEGAGILLIGLPLNADGSEGEMAKEVREFGAKLGSAVGVKATFWDERYTSLEAEERLRELYRDRKERKSRLDQAAAAIILRTWLERIED